jgi:hypothetical protein
MPLLKCSGVQRASAAHKRSRLSIPFPLRHHQSSIHRVRVERSLYERANGYNYEAVKVFMPAGSLGDR